MATAIADMTIRYSTRNGLPEESRAQLIGLLNRRLADAVDLATQVKVAHWNVKGPEFIALHKLFDDIHADVVEYGDLLGERLVQLGGIAEGTARIAAERSELAEYPMQPISSQAHVNALADALAAFGSHTRIAIDESAEMGDQATADIFTEITRGLDKWLWFVEAHHQQRADR